MVNLILLISLATSIITHNDRKTFKELIDKYLNKLDINDAYLSYDQYISLLQTLKNDFPNYIQLTSIGKTYKGNEMPLIIIKSPLISNDKSTNINSEKNNNSENIYTILSNKTYLIDDSLFNKSGIFFNGMHHGREPVSMMMNIYLILHLLSLPKVYLHLFLSSTNIYFLPIVNIDAYKYNSNQYFLKNSLNGVNARKNRKPDKKTECPEYLLGVDLNRNYDYFFGENDKGSSGSPCNERYRGEYPFSEPETNNIKIFIENHPDIKIALNYHTWGNLIVTPFNYLQNNESLILLQKEFPNHYKMYQDFEKEANYPPNFIFGNSQKTLEYLSNGDSADWLLGKKNILSFSPELGNGEKNSDYFYPNRNVTFDILEKNLYSALYAIQKSMFYLKSELLNAEYCPCSYKARYNDIYFNNKQSEIDKLRQIVLKNCFIDDIILKAIIKITNYGFGTYIPGIEFNYNINHPNDMHYESENHKKYFYFLALDLNVNLDNIRSICYWSNFLNHTKNGKNNTQKEDLKIRCVSNKGNELKDMKLFIDNEIKFLESIIINIEIIVKKDNFIEKKNVLTKMNQNNYLHNIYNLNNYSNNNSNKNETSNLINLFTKNERLIKSENINGEIIEWKFNNPSITIKIEEFKETKNSQFIVVRQNPFKFLIYMILSALIIVFFICRIIKLMRMDPSQEIIAIPGNERREVNRNYNNNNRQIVNNFENINQFNNNQYEQANLFNNLNNYQVDRDDNDSNFESL